MRHVRFVGCEGKFLELFRPGERGKYSAAVLKLCSRVVLAVHHEGWTLNLGRVGDRIERKTIEPRLLSTPIHQEFSGGKGGHMHELKAVPDGMQHGIEDGFKNDPIWPNSTLVYSPQQSSSPHGL